MFVSNMKSYYSAMPIKLKEVKCSIIYILWRAVFAYSARGKK